jgi:flagellar hook assembly protein FlgD
LRDQVHDAQGASVHRPAAGPLPGAVRVSTPARIHRLVVLIAVLVASAVTIPGPLEAAGGARPKAVVIVGPVGAQTASFLATGRRVANQAQAAGMDVRRVFHPKATWQRVLAEIQGAKLVVYVGHGNGWPSPYGPFQEDTKNGLGLNPGVGMSSSQVAYHGAAKLRAHVRLARGAVVLLYRLCYAPGNGEPWMGVERDRGVAARRVDNFAAGFLDVGAAAVFAFGHEQKANIPRLLARSNMTMDQIFRLRRSSPSRVDGFVGRRNVTIGSRRTSGARIHLDPDRSRGYYRALTGRLSMTAGQWRGGGNADRDRTPPRLRGVRVLSNGPLDPASITRPQFSPDGDGVGDRLRVGWSLSERGRVRAVVRNAQGRIIRTIHRKAGKGAGAIAWDGRADSGRRAADGMYRIVLVARDRAGNVSRRHAVRAKLATSLRSYRVSRRAIHTADRDGLARKVKLRVEVTRRASVGWRITDADGRVVRTLRSRPARPGTLVRTWGGLDDRRRHVPSGWYTATVVAKTERVGVRYAQRIWVGPFRVSGDSEARRGTRLTLTYRATEPLRRPPTVRVKQPGIKAYEVRTRKVGADRYRLSFTPRTKGKAGRLRLQVVGTDRGGGTERLRHGLRLR